MSSRRLINRATGFAVGVAAGASAGIWHYHANYDPNPRFGEDYMADAVFLGVATGITIALLVVVLLRATTGGYVFISYARPDGRYARRMRRSLRWSGGVRVWMDNKLRAGDQWPKTLMRRIDGCSALILIMSPASQASEWVAREVDHARKQDKPILPVLLSGDPPPTIADDYHFYTAKQLRRGRGPNRFLSDVTRHTG